jgi:tetratricopeptide (TPR) repeat protein
VGSKLAILAAVIGLATPAAADNAGELMKKGIDLYKAGKYDEAAKALKGAYEADRKPETLFALAQAQRLAGDCTSAAANYHKVIAEVSDMNVAKLVQQNLALCEKDEPKLPPEPAVAPPPEPAPEPKIVTRTVVRDVGHTDRVAAMLFGAGMLGLGASGGLYLAASSTRDAADSARTLDDHDRLASRASSEQVGMVVAAGVGLAAVGYAVFRWTRGGEAGKTDVAIVPTTTGGAVWVSSSW